MMADEMKVSTPGEEAVAPVAEEISAEAVVSEAVTEEVVAEEAVAEEAVAEEAVAEEAVAEEAIEENDIESKLKAAAGNIKRAKAEARARKSEQEKSQKQAEEDAQARLEEAEKRLQEEERIAQLVAEQKMAALDYAQNYRKKILKDRERSLSQAKLREKQEREEAEARIREEKAKEIAALLEKEREEARARGDKATALLNRVTKCAVVDDDGNLRMVDKLDLVKGKVDVSSADEDASEAVEPAVEKPAAEVVAEAPKPTVAAPTPAPVYEYTERVSKQEAARREVENFLVGEMISTQDDKFVLSIEDDRMVVNVTSADDPQIAEDGWSPTEEFYAREIEIAKSQHEYILNTIKAQSTSARSEMLRIFAEEQERFAVEMEALLAHHQSIADEQAARRQTVIDEINAAADEEAPEIAEIQEEPVADAADEAIAAVEVESGLEPVINDDPVVIELREMGEAVETKRQLKKYLKKSNKAVKKYNKQINSIDSSSENFEDERRKVSIIRAMRLCGSVLEIRCDNLSAAAAVGKAKLVNKCVDVLYGEIERYNSRATAFADISGVQLTRVSAFLPDHIANGTGRAVIPAMTYRERYEEFCEKPETAPRSYTFNFPSLGDLVNGNVENGYPTVTAIDEKIATNPVTSVTPIQASLTEYDLLGDKIEITSKRKLKKLRKRAAKADKKIAREVARLNDKLDDAATSVAALALERERVIVASRVLVESVKLGNAKFIYASKRALVEALARYNQYASACSAACDTPVTEIHSITADRVAEAALLPDVPVMAHVFELYETVGENTRIVGEPTDEEKNVIGGNCTFIFGGHAPVASTESDEASGALAGAAVAAAAGAAIGYAAAEQNEAAAEETHLVESNDEVVVAEEESAPLSKKELKKRYAAADKNYKKVKKEIEALECSKYGATAEDVVDIDVKILIIAKNLIDSVAEDVAVAHTSLDKSALKKYRARLNSEIVYHNSIVDELFDVANVTLTKASVDMYDEIVSGEGYRKTPKIEYQVTERAPAQEAVVVDQSEEEPVKPEYTGSATRAIKVMNKKELKRFLKNNDKKADLIRYELVGLSNQKNAAEGRDMIIAIVNCINAQRSIVELSIENLLASCQVGDKKYEKKRSLALDVEVDIYNNFVREYTDLTEDEITYADRELSSKIVLGKPYSNLPILSYTTETTAYSYDYADYTAYKVENENAEKLSRAQAHNRVEKSNAETYEIATLAAAVAKQANKDQRLIAARFMYEKNLLQSDYDMFRYRYGLMDKKTRLSRGTIEKKCKALDKKGKEALALERADNNRYYKVINTNPYQLKFKNHKKQEQAVALREKIMQLLNERDHLNGKLISIYEGNEVDLEGNTITMAMRRVKDTAASKEYKRQRRSAKKVNKLHAERVDKQKLYDLINTQIMAESTIAMSQHRLKHEQLTSTEKRQLRRDIDKNKSAKKSAKKQFGWLLKRIANAHRDAGGSWLTALGIILAVLLVIIVLFAWFFGGDVIANLGL
ncbi:MAG: hypothetical protein IJY69_03770 [Clostridia bacterium]|nr:hypothetical protein [Clostridia bacterium]